MPSFTPQMTAITTSNCFNYGPFFPSRNKLNLLLPFPRGECMNRGLLMSDLDDETKDGLLGALEVL